MASNLTGYGQPARYKYGQISTDRYGIVTGQITMDRHESNEIGEVNISLLLPGAEPSFIVPCHGRVRTYKGGIATYTYSYEGGPPGVSFAERIFCTLEGSDSEEPIETHPNFEAIGLKYSAEYDRTTGQFSHFARKLKDGKPNPVFGTAQFLSLGLVWTYTTIVRELPGNECRRVGCVDTPMGHAGMQPPTLGGRRNWLRCAPQARQRGNVIELTRKWMASGRNGWNKDIYTDKGVADSSTDSDGGDPFAGGASLATGLV